MVIIMIENSKERPIENLKIKYDENVYDKIVYFSISNWDGNERVSFTNKTDNNSSTSVNCKFSEIEIIKK